jgi:hypothetical protein
VSQNQALDCSELLFVKLAQYRRGGGDSAAAIVAVSIGAKMPKAAFVARVTALHRCDGFISDKLPFCYQTEETVSGLYQCFLYCHRGYTVGNRRAQFGKESARRGGGSGRFEPAKGRKSGQSFAGTTVI